MIVIVIGVMVFRVSPNYLWLILGSALAAIVGMALEILFFSVNYAGAQQVQFEDDEYYYYVKAIPKIAVSAPEKTVKKINERQESTEQHEPQNGQHVQQNGQQHRQQNGQHHRGGDAQEEWSSRRTEEELLKQSLNKELGIGHEREQ